MTAYSIATMTLAPLVYYRLGEATGTTAVFDGAGGGQIGAVALGVTPGVPGLLSGDPDTAMAFDGVSGQVTATIPALPQGAAAWSAVIWVQITATPSATAVVLDMGTRATNKDAQVYFNSSGVLHAGFNGGGDITATALSLGTPHFLALTYNGTTLTLYVDAVSVASTTTTGNLTGTGLALGSNLSGASFLAGTLDESAIFTTALTLAQVQYLYVAGSSATAMAAIAVPFNPLGQTRNIPNNNPGLPAQDIIDMAGGTGRGGTVPGWGAGVQIRYQQHWGQATEPNADHVYDWSAVDDTVDRCAAAGMSVLWVLSYPPTQYLTVRASDGVDTGVAGADYANAATWTYFCKQVAARYNGTTTNALSGAAQTARLIQELSIFNEEYDEGDHLPRDDQSKWLVPVVQQAAPAIMALHPGVILGVGAVRHTYNNSRDHIAAWLTNLFSYKPSGSSQAGIANLVNWISFHYYRGGGGDNFPNPDPNSSSSDMPSISEQIDLMFSVVQPLGFTGDIYCNEFGWACYAGSRGDLTVSQQTQSDYLFAVIDACRLHGVARIHIFTLNSGSQVDSTVSPPTADAVRSVVQTINGVYTYLPAYQMLVQYHHDHPTWEAASPIPANNPYGVTLYVNPRNQTTVPSQLIIDLTGGNGRGGFTSGWGNGAGLRWQSDWKSLEPNADHNYTWGPVDTAIDNCEAGGVYLMWSVAYAPDGYLNIDPATGGIVAAGTGKLASPDAWTYLFRRIAARYNGTTTNVITGATQTARVLRNIEISNEEYDAFAALDDQGKWLGDVAASAIPAFRAIHPSCRISLGSVHKKTANTLQHFTNWMNGLFAHMGGDLADAVSFHNYRGGQDDPNPLHGTTGNPSIPQIISTMKAALVANGSSADIECSEFGWNAYDDGSGTAAVFTQAVQSEYTLDVIDACRKNGVYRTFLFWIDPSAKVDLTTTPVSSTSSKSIVQTISGTYTYLQAYGDIATYQQAHPVWGTTQARTTKDTASRLNLVPTGSVTALTLYASQTASATVATGNTFVSGTGGTTGNKNTAVGSASNWGEIYAQGATAPWPALGSRSAPSGHGFFLDASTLDGKTIVGGTWTASVTIGARDTTLGVDSSLTADLYLRVSRYRGGSYTTLGTLFVSNRGITSSAVCAFPATIFATAMFLPGDRLYCDLWAHVTTPSPSANCFFRLAESTSATLGVVSNMQLTTPGFQTTPITVVKADVASRLRLAAAAGIGILDIYGAQTVSVESATAGTFALTAGATTPPATTTRVNISTGYGELPAQGSTAAWPGLGALGTPSGHGYFLDSNILDAQTIAAGNWTASVRMGTHDDTANVAAPLQATMFLRAYRYRSGAYTLLGTLSVAITTSGLTSVAFPATAFLTASFLTGDRLYVDLWANVTVAASVPLGDIVVFRVIEALSSTQGVTNGMHLTIPGSPGSKTQASLDMGSRLNFITPGVAGPLSIYGTTIPAFETLSGGSFATDVGGTQVTVTTAIGTASGYGELPALGTVSSWPSLGDFAVPTGKGYFLDLPLLDGAQIAGGTWSATVRLGTDSPGLTATVSLRLYRYAGGTYIPLGTLDAVDQTLNGLVDIPLSGPDFPIFPFAANDRLYADLWLAIITPTTDGAAVMNVIVTNTPGLGDENCVAVTTPGVQALSVTTSRNLSSRLRLTPAPVVVGSGTYVDLTRFKTQMVMVYAADGTTFIDCWRDAPLLFGFKETWNSGISTLSVTLPRAFDQFDAAGAPGNRGSVALGNVVKYLLFGPGLPSSGLLRYQGVIDSFEQSIDQQTGEEHVTVILTPYSAVLTDHGLLGQPVVFGPHASDVVTMAKWFFDHTNPITGKSYMDPLIWDVGNPTTSGVSTTYTFQNQDMASVFTTLMQMLVSAGPNWFYRINPDKTFTMNNVPIAAQHTVIVGQHLSGVTHRSDASQLKNVIFFEGATTSVVTASGFTAQVPLVTSIQQGADVALYGERLHLASDSRATTQHAADILAKGLLTELDIVECRATLCIPDYRGDGNTAIGADIETFHVGDSLRLLSLSNTPTGQTLWNAFNWDQGYWDYSPSGALDRLTHIESITYNFDSINLELSTQQPSLSKHLLRLQRKLQDFTVI